MNGIILSQVIEYNFAPGAKNQNIQLPASALIIRSFTVCVVPLILSNPTTINIGTAFNSTLFANAIDASTLNSVGVIAGIDGNNRLMDNTLNVVLVPSAIPGITSGVIRTYVEYYAPVSLLPNVVYVPPVPVANIGGGGTGGYLAVFTGAETIGNSSIEDGTVLTINKEIQTDSLISGITDTSVAISFFAGTLSNNGGGTTINWLQYKLYNSTGQVIFNWNNGLLNDSTGTKSINLGARLLFDSSDLGSVDYNNRNLLDSAGDENLNWETPGEILFSGSFETAAPAGGVSAAAQWEVGSEVAAVSVLDTSKYIEVNIGGTLYKLATMV